MSQLEREKPVMQFAWSVSRRHLSLRKERNVLYHLDNHQLPPTPHLTRLRLPHARRRRVHARPQASHHPTDHHLRDAVRRSLDDGADSDDGAPDEDLARPAKKVTRPDGRHGTDEAANVVDGGHGGLHVGGGVAHGLEEVVADDDVAEDALHKHQSGSRLWVVFGKHTWS